MPQNKVRFTFADSTLKLDFVSGKYVRVIVCEVLSHFDGSKDSLVFASSSSGWESRINFLDQVM